jgi:hypothetical protein
MTEKRECYADTVVKIVDMNSYHKGSYLKNIYLRGGCMIDQRMIVAVLPPRTIIKQATFDNNSVPGYTRDIRCAKTQPDR